MYKVLSAHADQTQANLRNELERRGIDYKPYYLVNAIQVQAGPRARLWLQAHPDVDRVPRQPLDAPIASKTPLWVREFDCAACTGLEPADDQR